MSAQDKSMTVAIEGELSIFTVAALRQRLLDAFAAGTAVEADLAGVTEMDSAGLQLVLSAAKQARASGTTFRLVRCSAAAADILALCGLGELAVSEAGARP